MGDAITRRQFIAMGATASAVLAVGSVAGCSPPDESTRSDIDTPSTHYEGNEAMGKRVMVGYATRNGSTIGVAEAIGETLSTRGYDVDVVPLKDDPSLEGYDAAVLGSAVNGGAWLPEAVQFVESHRDTLAELPCAVFCVHAMNLGDSEKATRKREAYIDNVRDAIHPADEAYFVGVGPLAEDTSAIARWAFKAFGGGAEGDARDWDAIRAWATQAKV